MSMIMNDLKKMCMLLVTMMVTWHCASDLQAQELEVLSISAEPNEILTGEMLRKDLNGNYCALVKVFLPVEGAKFDGEVIGDVDFDVNEYYVYLVDGSKMLQVKCPGHFTKMIDFRDFGVSGVRAKRVYSLKLIDQAPSFAHVNSELGRVTFFCDIEGAEVMVDGQSVGVITDGKLTVMPKEGNTLVYTVKKEGYNDVSGSVIVGDNIAINIKFEPITSNGYGAVDLGLSVKWASCNIGASKPSDYGAYFAWGEIFPKSHYTPKNSDWYGKKTRYLKSKGVIDKKDNLQTEYDIASVHWGDNWRMPTLGEINELIDKCTWIWASEDDHSGYKVFGPNGNFIFLPAAGYCDAGSLNDVGSGGCYWSATALYDVNCAQNLNINSILYGCNGSSRYYGQSVRPVTQ